MKTTLTMLLAFACLNCFSQKTLTKKDELTGNEIKTAYIYLTGMLNISNAQVLVFTNDAHNKSFGVSMYGGLATTLYNNYPADSLKLIVKFDDDKILRMNANSKYSKIMATNIGAVATIAHDLTTDELSEFINHKVKIVRLSLVNDQGYDLKNISDNYKKIIKAAEYIN